LVQHIVLKGDRYVIPRRDGHILVGSTLEHRGFDKATSQAAHDSLLAAAMELFPVLSEHPLVRQWAGLRPGSPHGIPYICKHPAMGGLYLNTGHFRNGVVLGPASARLLADMLLERTPILDPVPYGFTAPRE
jgi:glycine oxidase